MSTLRRIARRVLRGPSRTLPAPGERPIAWYDALYRTSADFAAHYRQSHYYFLWCVIADRLRGVPSVLEVGCGPGQLAHLLFDQGLHSYAGFDFSPVAIDAARNRLGERARLWVGDARDPANFTTPCAALICTEVLEHVDADLTIVANFPAGVRCLCTVPSFPYESHVRNFKDAAEVLSRYGAFFVSPTIITLPSPKGQDDRFYLLDGVKR